MESAKENEVSEIKIITKEGKEFTLSKKSCELSELLKSAINDYPTETSYPLNELDEKNAELIKEFLSHFNGEAPKEIEKPIQSNEMKNLTDEWSSNFIDKIPLEDLTNLTVAANYMGINSLLDLCCAKVATMCKDKNEDEILKMFKISETFNEEEKNKIKSENKWIEENL
jgi:S-phase kinase-associated protein 1